MPRVLVKISISISKNTYIKGWGCSWGVEHLADEDRAPAQSSSTEIQIDVVSDVLEQRLTEV